MSKPNSPSTISSKKPKKFEISKTLIIPPPSKEFAEKISKIDFANHDLYEFENNEIHPYSLLLNSIKAGGPFLILLAILCAIVYIGAYIMWGLGLTFYYETLKEKEFCNLPLLWMLVQSILTISMLLIVASIFINYGFGKITSLFLMLVSMFLLISLISFAWLCHGTSLYLKSSYADDYTKCYNTFNGAKLINYIRVWITISWITGSFLASYFIAFFITTLCFPKRFNGMYEQVGKFVRFE